MSYCGRDVEDLFLPVVRKDVDLVKDDQWHSATAINIHVATEYPPSRARLRELVSEPEAAPLIHAARHGK